MSVEPAGDVCDDVHVALCFFEEVKLLLLLMMMMMLWMCMCISRCGNRELAEDALLVGKSSIF